MTRTTIITIVTIPVISALIGWITNYIAVKMIFRPYIPVKIFGFKIQGLIPMRRAELATKIGQTVEKELITHADIHGAVNTPEFREEILTTLLGAIDGYIVEKTSGNPLIAMFLGGSGASSLKDKLRDELRPVLPSMMESLFEKMEDRLDLKDIVRKKIDEFDLLKLETIIYDIAAKELKAIEYLGGVLGFVIGLVQLAIALWGRSL